jgi:14-3-3 protein epsilon
MIALLKPYVE